MTKLKSGDSVIVVAWKFKGKTTTIDKMDWDKAYLKDVNIVKKAVKWKGYIEKTLPVHASNVMFYSKTEKKWVRLWFEIDKKGKKVRIAKNTKDKID